MFGKEVKITTSVEISSEDNEGVTVTYTTTRQLKQGYSNLPDAKEGARTDLKWDGIEQIIEYGVGALAIIDGIRRFRHNGVSNIVSGLIEVGGGAIALRRTSRALDLTSYLNMAAEKTIKSIETERGTYGLWRGYAERERIKESGE